MLSNPDTTRPTPFPRLAALFAGGRGVLVVATVASYAAGLVRDRVFAHTFGASRALDAYQAAFLVPDLLLTFLVTGGLAAAFVPLYAAARADDPARADRFARTVTTLASLLMLVVGVALALAAPVVARLVAPGFSPEELRELAGLVRILAFSPVVFAASNALGGVLVAEKRFLTYGLSPVFYNGGIIAGTLLLAGRFGIRGAAWGTLVGAALHLGVRIVELMRLKKSLAPALDLSLPELRRFWRLMLPKMVSHPVEQATFWAYTAMASAFAPGSIAVLAFARNFQSVPVSVVGIAFATASFAVLSETRAAGAYDAFCAEYRRTLRDVVVLSLAGAVLLYLLREEVVGLLLGGGAFGPGAVAATASLLASFLPSVPLEAMSHQQARAFYALEDTVTPAWIALVNLGVSVGVAWALLPLMNLSALGLGYAAGSAMKVALQAWLLPRRLRRVDGPKQH